ncbi:uncharacterized protein BROUX77_004361 [Berkeleyomyces rouxiae]|uniref:uncharacterized protein n=1 Tax=Berkeleyomyces rouxiae TaxID=2035830 RepID=UPI003B7CC1E5
MSRPGSVASRAKAAPSCLSSTREAPAARRYNTRSSTQSPASVAGSSSKSHVSVPVPQDRQAPSTAAKAQALAAVFAESADPPAPTANPPSPALPLRPADSAESPPPRAPSRQTRRKTIEVCIPRRSLRNQKPDAKQHQTTMDDRNDDVFDTGKWDIPDDGNQLDPGIIVLSDEPVSKPSHKRRNSSLVAVTESQNKRLCRHLGLDGLVNPHNPSNQSQIHGVTNHYNPPIDLSMDGPSNSLVSSNPLSINDLTNPRRISTHLNIEGLISPGNTSENNLAWTSRHGGPSIANGHFEHQVPTESSGLSRTAVQEPGQPTESFIPRTRRPPPPTMANSLIYSPALNTPTSLPGHVETGSQSSPEFLEIDFHDFDSESIDDLHLDVFDSEDESLDDDIPYRRSNRRAANRSAGAIEAAQKRLVDHHPFLKTMWEDLEVMPAIEKIQAPQPEYISRQLKPFQREGLHWMMEMEKMKWKGGLLGDEMGLGKTIQAVSLIMSDFPVDKPSLVLIPPVALLQWVSEIKSYTNGRLRTFVYHNSRAESRNMTIEKLREYDVILISYNSLESLYRRQTKGLQRGKKGQPKVLVKTDSPIHQIDFHRVILDEAHEIKTRSTSTAKACFALKATYRWCLSGTPLQNRIGEFFSLLRFINIRPFASYICRSCSCESLEWSMNDEKRCNHCGCFSTSHISIFNRELLNPIQKFGNFGAGKTAFTKLKTLTNCIMLRRQKKDHMDVMELPVKELRVSRELFGDVEKDLANSIMNNSQRKFDTYVARRVLLNNYANIFGLIMQMRQVADHPDLILRKNTAGAEGVLECSICESPAEDAIRSRCKHDFCRMCAREFVTGGNSPDCPRCHIPLAIDLKQPEIAQEVSKLKNTSIINRIRMENWTSSTKIELLLHELYMLRSDRETLKVIIFSQFTSMLQLIEWRLRHAGFSTVMLDGSMTPAQRAASIDHFMNNVDVECFLVSLRAGGVALNLTEASRVFLIEPWWNPAVEWQSADRCHRIGQCRPCTITNLVIEDSVESRMVMLQEKKAHMIKSTINNDTKAMQSLSAQDLMFLFRGT